MGEHMRYCIGIKWIVVGLILILVRMYTTWDIWIVLGVLIILKGIMKFFMPMYPYYKPEAVKGKKK